MVLIIGHRGARNLWPENSLEGFRRTRDLGVDAVEFDVHLARDGELVVIHDPSLERTTEGTGPVADRTAARSLPRWAFPASRRCSTSMPARRSSCMSRSRPTLSAEPYEGLEKRLLDVIGRRKLEQQAIVTSFVPEILETVRRLSPQQRVLARSTGARPSFSAVCRRRSTASLSSATAWSRSRRDCWPTVSNSACAGSAARFLGAWVPNDADDIARWLARPIRQITTDRPDVALALRAR